MRGVPPTEENSWDDVVGEQGDSMNAITNIIKMIKTIKTKMTKQTHNNSNLRSSSGSFMKQATKYGYGLCMMSVKHGYALEYALVTQH